MLASALGKITNCSAKMDDPKLDKKTIGMTTSCCANIKGDMALLLS